MTRAGFTRLLPVLSGLIGLAGALCLFVWEGIAPVMDAFTAAGFGIVIAALAHFLSMSLNARAWQLLLPRGYGAYRRPDTLFFIWAVWLREAVNGLLPVARIGGEVATARLLIGRGVRGSLAVALLVLDVTVSLGSQLVFTLLGVALLILQDRQPTGLRELAAGMLLIVPIIAIFVVVQRAGLFTAVAGLAQRLFGDGFQGMAGSAIILDRIIGRLYRRRRALLACGLWQLAGWVAGGSEVWLCLYFLGHPLTFFDAVIIEALIQAVSSAAFIVPGALGVQEGSFVIAGSWLGLPHDTALALALMRRARDVLIFIPALLIWQSRWGLRLWRQHKPA